MSYIPHSGVYIIYIHSLLNILNLSKCYLFIYEIMTLALGLLPKLLQYILGLFNRREKRGRKVRGF